MTTPSPSTTSQANTTSQVNITSQAYTTSQANINVASTPRPTMNTDYTKTVNVKKVPLDGTEASFYLWTIQLLGFAVTYNCAQALLGTIAVPPDSDVLSDAIPDAHNLLQGRRANSTAMVLLRISLTDDLIVDQIYTSSTPELPQGSARKLWVNLHKMFYPVSTEKMHHLKNEFTMCLNTPNCKG
jgi:hypothetical protein